MPLPGKSIQHFVGAMLVASAAAIGYFLYRSLAPTGDHSIFLQVILMGALGAHVTVGLAFAKHSGDFDPAIVWWYPIRLVEGAFVAVAFWLALKAALAGFEMPVANEPWPALAYSALAGMYSHTIIAKLGGAVNGDADHAADHDHVDQKGPQ